MEPGDRVATLAWNNHRHLELYYAVSGAQGVIHTLNPRLFPEQLAYIIGHAEDRWIFTELTFLPLLEALAPHLGRVEGFVVMTDRDHMPKESRLHNLLCFEELLEGHPERFAWPEFDERTAASLCYTSGTTGHPKGVLYSHRSTVLHTYACAAGDLMAAGRGDVVMAVVPMFHANAWGLPYAAPICGAKLILPGPKMGDGRALQELIEGEGVTYAAGVPTIWLGLLEYMRESGTTVPSLRWAGVGGAACPPSIIREFRDRHGVTVVQGWGMTEMSPVGTLATLTPDQQALPEAERVALQATQGRPVYGVEMKITDDEGRELPWDGQTSGRLKVRGWWVCSSYFRPEPGAGTSHDEAGWFDTGDVAVIHPDRWLQITDRAKDVIKSGGEWISSIDIENVAMEHPEVAEAAVIGVPHPKWSERPILIVRPRGENALSAKAMLQFFDGRIASWWTPDDVVFIDDMPHTSTGKVNKLALRERFRDYTLPESA
jgi:fatty-acyl-CoA synthase